MQDADTIHSTEISSSHNNTPEHFTLPLQNSDLILDYLTSIGVEFVFGVPGGAIEPLYNALARSERTGGIKAVISRHETGAAFMADGYSRESGLLGVCCATTGPGTTNLITGVASAYADNIPMLVITPQTALPSFGRYGLQESSCTGVNTVAMLEHCTRYNTLVSHPDQLERKLLTAINHAFGPAPGPVHLSIPIDILKEPIEPYEKIDFSLSNRFKNIIPTPADIKALSDITLNQKNVTVVMGEGCEGSTQEILKVVEFKGWSIVTTPMAKGLIPSHHPNYGGVFGMAGHKFALDLLKKQYADTVMLIGANLDEIATAGWDEETIYSTRLVHIDDNTKNLAQSSVAKLQVYGSPSLVFEALTKEAQVRGQHNFQITSIDSDLQAPAYLTSEEKMISRDNDSDIDQIMPVKPQYLIRQLSQRCPKDTRVAADSGCSYLWAIHYWEFEKDRDNKNLFRAGMGYSSMGWAIGASIGLSMAAPNHPVVCITGDGSLLMSGQEITVAQTENTNILFIILNDSSLGMVKHGQRLANAEPIGFHLDSIDFSQVAEAMGIESYRISSKADFDALDIMEIFRRPGPCVLDIVIDGEELPPMGLRMKVLGGE